MSKPRVFSEKEAADILQRAARIQESSAGSYSAGVTYEELQRIASETGIDEASLQKALDAPLEKTTRILNLVEETERVIEGELAPEAMDAFAEVLSKYGRVQNGSQIGRSFNGYVNGGTIYAKVELHSRNGRTRIKVKSMPVMAYLFGMHIPLILGITSGAAMMGNGLVAAGAAVMAMLFTIGFVIFNILAKKSMERSRQMADEIQNELLALTSKPSVVPQTQDAQVERLQQRLSES